MLSCRIGGRILFDYVGPVSLICRGVKVEAGQFSSVPLELLG